MIIVLITGSAGLIGSEATCFFHERGFDIVGVDNNMREYFFGADGSTTWNRAQLESGLVNYRHRTIDIRDAAAIDALFAEFGTAIKLVIHTAAQPSHDWAAREPITDFTSDGLPACNFLYVKHVPNRRPPKVTGYPPASFCT